MFVNCTKVIIIMRYIYVGIIIVIFILIKGTNQRDYNKYISSFSRFYEKRTFMCLSDNNNYHYCERRIINDFKLGVLVFFL